MVLSQQTPSDPKTVSEKIKSTGASVTNEVGGELKPDVQQTPLALKAPPIDKVPQLYQIAATLSEESVSVDENRSVDQDNSVQIGKSASDTSESLTAAQKPAAPSSPRLTQPISPMTQHYLAKQDQPQLEEPLPSPRPPDFLAPHSVEAEEALLGSLIISPDMYDEVSTFLKPDDFFLLRNSWVYEAIARIRGRSEAVDHLTVSEELRTQNRLQEAGANYSLYLLNNTPISTHAVVYAKIIERAAVRRRLIEAAGKIATIANSGSRDIHEVIHDAELALADVTEQRSSQKIVGNIDSPTTFLKDLVDRMEMQDTDGVTGVRVGYKHLDQLLGGLQAGELYVVAGRSKSGKSAFMLNLARGSAANGSSIGFFSLEMNLNQLQRRLHAIETGINTQKMRLGAVNSEEFRKIAESTNRVQSYDIYWDETPRISVLELRTKCRYLKRRYGVHMVVIDYLQLLKPSDASLRRDNRERQLATISEMLKEMARELNMAVVVAAQLNREVFKSDNKRPRIEHIRDSDAIVHNADVVMLWHCPQTVDENAPKNGAAKLYIEKHRDGPQTELDFHYDLACQRIREVEFETIDLSTY